MKNNELKKVVIKNCKCYYFDDVIKIEQLDFNNISLDENHENILIYDVSYKSLIGAKPLHIMFDKVAGFIIRDYNGTIYSLLFGSEKFDTTFDRIRNLTGLKSSIRFFVIIMQKLKMIQMMICP